MRGLVSLIWLAALVYLACAREVNQCNGHGFPSAIPTNKPTTSNPTAGAAPTTKFIATNNPTNKPTSKPSAMAAPTTKDIPTNYPTNKPTSKPTAGAAPTSKSIPTNYPTSIPTSSPSKKPTMKPTKPTAGKTTQQPTKQPTPPPTFPVAPSQKSIPTTAKTTPPLAPSPQKRRLLQTRRLLAAACACFEGYAGTNCDTCATGFYGYPECQKCNCNSGTCTPTGTCNCPDGTVGANCQECLPGYFGPECLKCPNCLNGGTCDDSVAGNGKCQCRVGFAGKDCSVSSIDPPTPSGKAISAKLFDGYNLVNPNNPNNFTVTAFVGSAGKIRLTASLFGFTVPAGSVVAWEWAAQKVANNVRQIAPTTSPLAILSANNGTVVAVTLPVANTAYAIRCSAALEDAPEQSSHSARRRLLQMKNTNTSAIASAVVTINTMPERKLGNGACRVQQDLGSSLLTSNLTITCSGFVPMTLGQPSGPTLKYIVLISEAGATSVPWPGGASKSSASTVPIKLEPLPPGDYTFSVTVYGKVTDGYTPVELVLDHTVLPWKKPPTPAQGGGGGGGGSGTLSPTTSTAVCTATEQQLFEVWASVQPASSRAYFEIFLLKQLQQNGCDAYWQRLWKDTFARFNSSVYQELLLPADYGSTAVALNRLFAALPQKDSPASATTRTYASSLTKAAEVVVSVSGLLAKYLEVDLKGSPPDPEGFRNTVCVSTQQVLQGLLLQRFVSCDLVDKITGILEAISCQCVYFASLPGEKSDVDALTKCAVNSATSGAGNATAQCGELPGDLSVDPALWESIFSQLDNDPVFGKVASITVLPYSDKVAQCRPLEGSASILGNVTSITITNGCDAIDINNTIINFSLPITANGNKEVQDECGKLVKPVLSCSWWEPASQTWKSDGCVVVESTDTAVRCKCSHLTDFAILAYVSRGCSSAAKSDLSFFIAIGLSVLVLVTVSVQLSRLAAFHCRNKRAGRKLRNAEAALFRLLCTQHSLLWFITVLRLGWTVNLRTANFSAADRTVMAAVSIIKTSLLFYAFSSIVIKWAFLHHCSMDKEKQRRMNKGVLGVNIGVLFLLIAQLTLIVLATYDVDFGLTTAEILLFGACLYAVLSFSLAISFLVYGIKISKTLAMGESDSKKTRQDSKRIKRLGIVLAVVFLLLAAINPVTQVLERNQPELLMALKDTYNGIFTLTLFSMIFVYHKSVATVIKKGPQASSAIKMKSFSKSSASTFK